MTMRQLFEPSSIFPRLGRGTLQALTGSPPPAGWSSPVDWHKWQMNLIQKIITAWVSAAVAQYPQLRAVQAPLPSDSRPMGYERKNYLPRAILTLRLTMKR